MNEMALLCEEINVNIWEVIEAASTKPMGFSPFYPNIGVGGHCIPVDPYYLQWKAKSVGRNLKSIQLADQLIKVSFEHIYNKIVSIKSGSSCNYLVIGIGYKENTNDIRRSPAIQLMNKLNKDGAKIKYFDKYVGEVRIRNLLLKSENTLKDEVIQWADVIILNTSLDIEGYQRIIDKGCNIYDVKDYLSGYKEKRCEKNIITLGNGME